MGEIKEIKEKKKKKKKKSDFEDFRHKIPWIFKGIRIPKIYFPNLRDNNLEIPTFSGNILFLFVFIFLFWLIMGGVYLRIPDTYGNFPISLGADSEGNPVWILNDINDAFIIESLVAAFLIFLGAMGFIILSRAIHYKYDVAFAQKMIFFGLVLIIISFVLLQYILREKLPDWWFEEQ